MRANGTSAEHGFVVTIRGMTGPAVSRALEGMEVEVVPLGEVTQLRSVGTDQAALHGLLQRIQDLGLEIVDVHREMGHPC
jgi:hypothetical protein